MIEFILNRQIIKTDERAGSTLLDFVRYLQHLTGTKIGCREGDCGACTLLVGSFVNGSMHYKSVTSCITPLGNVHGKHVVSIEGLNLDTLTPYQQAMVDSSGSQCGMCTVGFIVSFAGVCLSHHDVTYEQIISAIDGNICRCTGYKSIERAAQTIAEKLKTRPKENMVSWLIQNNFIPPYFSSIPERISQLNGTKRSKSDVIVGGGTDLLVQKHDEISQTEIDLISDVNELTGIQLVDGVVRLKAATNTTSLLESTILQDMFPRLWQHVKLVSSTPIRNIATIGGNIINASPIGDLTAIFMALNARLILENKLKERRIVALKDFYTAYKTYDLREGEILTEIVFDKLKANAHFNFEKVSKRRFLDIATVNTGILIETNDDIIRNIHLSAGGVGPTPAYLNDVCLYLINKTLSPKNILAAIAIAQQEVSPISDVRGSEKYKRLLLKQLLFSHFIELFPNKFQVEHLHEKH